MDTKVCRECGKEKPLTEFYKEPRSRNGYKGRCKACVLRRQAYYYAHKIPPATPDAFDPMDPPRFSPQSPFGLF